MKFFVYCVAFIVGFACLSVTDANAKVALNKLFSDGAVLQRQQAIPVWGTANPSEKVTVTLGKFKAKTTVANKNGHWRVSLDSAEAGGPYDLIVTGDNTIKVRDVLVGEVWLCVGQSNMMFPLHESHDGKAQMAKANYAQIRWYTVDKVQAKKRREQSEGQWLSAEGDRAGLCSAVAYHYARELHENLKVPVGIVECSVAGSPIISWMSRESLEAMKSQRGLFAHTEAATADGPVRVDRHAHIDPVLTHVKSMTTLFNGMIAPLVPYAIKGVVWYQGETDAYRAADYSSLFCALIDDWRAEWNQKDETFPFLFVQLPNFANSGGPSWANLREAQKGALEMQRTYMAVSLDVGEANELHPKNKRSVGHRLALIALANVYGRDCEYSGPVYESMSVLGQEVRLHFSHASGLKVKGQQPGVRGFEIAGLNGKFFPAQAKIEGTDVVLWSDDVKEPAEVRYAWGRDNSDCMLCNGVNLPASPFRADVRVVSIH